MAKSKNKKFKKSYSVKRSELDKKVQKVLELIDESESDPSNKRKKTLVDKEVDKVLHELETRIEKIRDIKNIIKKRHLDVKKIAKSFEKEGLMTGR